METDRANETNFWCVYIYIHIYFSTRPFRFLEFQKDSNLSRRDKSYENEIIHFVVRAFFIFEARLWKKADLFYLKKNFIKLKIRVFDKFFFRFFFPLNCPTIQCGIGEWKRLYLFISIIEIR